MKKNSLATIIIMIIMILVTVRFLRFFPIAPIILFIVVFRFVRSFRNRDRREDDRNYGTEQEEEKTFDQEDREPSRKENDDVIITCEYCGSKVDTGKYAVCNHCGGPYWDNQEWKEIQRRRNGTRR